MTVKLVAHLRPTRTVLERWYRNGTFLQVGLQVVLIVMKIAGVLTWPWWRVTMPYWGGCAVLLFFMLRYGAE